MRQRDREAAEGHMAEVARLQTETAVRIETMRDMLAGRQAELGRAVNERLDLGDPSSQPVHDHDRASTRSRACRSSTSGWR